MGGSPGRQQLDLLLVLSLFVIIPAIALLIDAASDSVPGRPTTTPNARSIPAVVRNAPPSVATPTPTPATAAAPIPERQFSAGHARIAAPSLGGGAQTSEYMAGKIVYGVVFVESAGGAGHCTPADPDLETWDQPRMERALTEIEDGLQFWLDRSGRPSELSFVREDWGTRATSCEAITRRVSGPSSDEGKWVADVLNSLDVVATPTDYVGAASAFAQSRRAALDVDWSFTVLVVDSLNDADGCFADADCFGGCKVLHRCLSAYSHLNGPYLVMTWDNGDWGADSMNGVMAHETGHIFGAADEYATQPGEPGCSTADTYGYLNVPNASCNNGGITDDISIMAGFDEVTHPNVDVSESARHAIGWRNPQVAASGKVVVDVIKNAGVRFTGVPPSSASRNPCFFATASAIPATVGGRNTSGRFHSPSNAARVASVEWNVDGGPFLPGVPYDRALDEASEEYYFAPARPLSDGKHTFGTRAITDLGAVSPVIYHDANVSKDAGTRNGSFDPDNCRDQPITRPN